MNNIRYSNNFGWIRVNAIAIAMVFAFTTLPRDCHAGLKEALNEMFVSTSTNPQAFETQRLKGITGGSMTLRTAGRGISIVQFAAPKIDAGCGGIDVFFGSFSFINGAQFEQLVRSIAANAVGFAIHAAINQMCSPCGAIIEKLETAIRELNAMAKNTCAIANQLMTSEGRTKLMEQASKIGTNISSAVGLVSDALAGENKRISTEPNVTASGGTVANGDQNPYYGNLTYKAAQSSLANGMNTLSAFLPQSEAIELVMGLFGTQIIGVDPANGQLCDASVPKERCNFPPRDIGPTITDWDQLFRPAQDGSSPGVKVLRCADTACITVTDGILPISAWSGVDGFIRMGLFGTTDSNASSSTYTPDSIIGAFVHKTPLTNETASPQARAIISIAPVPILNALMKVQKIPNGPELFGLQLAEMLPDFVAYKLGLDILTIGNNVFSGQTGPNMPADYERNLILKSQSLTKMRPKGTELTDIMIKSVESVKAMQQLTRSKFRSGGSD